MDTQYGRLAEALTTSLQLRLSPVAVCFTDSSPVGVPAHDGQAPAGCRFWQDALTATFTTTSDDHALCAIGVYTHNLVPSPAQQTDLTNALKVFADLGYVTPQDLPLIPALASRSRYITYAPLAQSPLPPDVVLLVVNSNQMLILSEAVQQVENQNAPAMGRPACAVIPQVMNTERAALSLGCCGARAYLDVLTEDVALYALPGNRLAAYVERIETLSKANGILTHFHKIRREDIEANHRPTVEDSLKAMSRA